jgi:phage gpG-like protein
MYVISITGEGGQIAALQVGLSRLLRLTDDISSAWPAVTQELRDIMAEQFTSQGALGQTGRWAPLEGRYAARKRRQYPGRTILERTGALRASLQVSTGQSIVERSPRALFFGTSVPYAGYHQSGTEKMPRRAIFAMTNRQAARIGSVLHKWLGAEMSQAFARAA